MKSIVFVTEASSDTGFGHLLESINLAKELPKYPNVIFLINKNRYSTKLLENFSYIVYEDIKELSNIVKKCIEWKVIIINLKLVSLELMNEIEDNNKKIIVIDELGNKPIVSDILINPSVKKKWKNYSFPSKKPINYFGPKYTLLNKDFSLLHRNKRSPSEVILITMGGADKTCSTAKIMNALKNTDYIKEVVVGPGFRNRRELEIINKKSKHKFELIDGLKNISNLILEASVIFTAGGDTLYEAACIGTPAIVLWEDIHEKKQADWFTREGSAINLGQGTVVEGKKIEEITIRLQNNVDKWIKMSNSGKRIIDGKGVERIVKIIRSSIPN